MDLAERFNEASEALAARGHRVVVRRARALVGGGDTGAAVAFLTDAGSRMRDADLSGLADSLRDWADGGGDPSALVSGDAWVSGMAAESKLADTIARQFAAQQSIVDDLVPHGADESRAQPRREMSPSQMPPLPTRPQAEPEAPRASAAVEERSQLRERKLELSDAPRPAEPEESLAGGLEASPAPTTPEPSDPPVELQASAPAPPASEPEPPAAEPEPPAHVGQPAPSDAIMKTGFENLPQLDAPPSLEAPAPPKQASKGGGGLAVAVIALVAVGAAVAYFLFLKP